MVTDEIWKRREKEESRMMRILNLGSCEKDDTIIGVQKSEGRTTKVEGRREKK